MRDHRWWVGLAILLPVVFLLPFLDGFFYNAGSAYTDMAISHYPNALWLKESIFNIGQVPLWSSTILSGFPFFAEPLSGLHYPFGWPAILLPLPFGLNLMAVLHLAFGGLGMYLFLRREDFEVVVAIFGAIAYEAMPKLFAHLGAGHLTLVYAAAWAPWLLAAQQAANRQPRRYWMLPGLVLGIIFLADPRYAAVTGVLWAVYQIQWWFGRLESRPGQLWLSVGLRALGTVAISLGVGAFLLLPMLEYLGLSTRSLMAAEDMLALSLPPLQILGLLVPNMAGSAEWVVYPGAAVLALAILAFFFTGRKRSKWIWGIFFAATVVWSLGENIPGLALISRLPGFNLLRVPPRMLLAGFVGLIWLSCAGLQGLQEAPLQLRGLPRFFPLPVLVGLAFFLVVLSVAVGIANHSFPVQFAWGAASLAVVLGLLFLARGGKISTRAVRLVFCLALLVDTSGVNLIGMNFRPTQVVLAEGAAGLARLANESGLEAYRVYSPSYSLPQQTAAALGLQLADGIDPLQLVSYSQFMTRATGVPANGYSVTLPPFSSGDPAVDNAAYQPDLRLLGVLNVRYVVSEYPLTTPGLEWLRRVGGASVYRNEFEKPRAWVQGEDAPLGDDLRGAALVQYTPNRLVIRAQGPGLLVVSENYYPGWQAQVDGQPVQIQPVSGLLRGVRISEGDHQVVMDFRPPRFFFGLGISLVTLLVCVFLFYATKGQAHDE